MRRLRAFALALTSLTCAASVLADSPEENIRAALGKVVPGIEIGQIAPTPIAGLYEVTVGADVKYFTGDGRYLVTGHLVDIQSREDLTEARLGEARKRLVAGLGEDQMVSFGPENPKHTVTVFTDIECGYCRKLHSQIADYEKEGIRVRYLFFPRAGKGSPAYQEAVSVWCAGDADARRQAMTDAKAGKKIEEKTCDNPVDAHMALGAELGLRGTPAILTEEGQLIPGYVEPKRLAAELNGAAGD